MKTTAFTTALKFAHHAASKRDIRFYLIGVLFEFTPDALHLVGCDGVRLAAATLEETQSFEGQFIVSTESVKHILTLFGKDKTDVTFARTDKGFEIKLTSGMTYAPTLVDGRFPDWRRVVPADVETPGTMPYVDAAQIGEAYIALAPLCVKYKGVAAIRTDAAGPGNAIKLRPANRVEHISDACVVVMPVRE